jgi:DNA-binding GntR family transcriptional regulator
MRAALNFLRKMAARGPMTRDLKTGHPQQQGADVVNRRIQVNTEDLPAPPHAATGHDIVVTTHESVYRQLRERILFGVFLPGGAVTLRGLAEELGVSPMPVREAVRRLIAERALTMQDNRRVLVPAMTREKFEQILFAREALEPELAARALQRLTAAGVDAIAELDRRIDQSMLNGDVDSYMRGNFRFHFAIYEHADADTLQALVESIWLQFGPFMRMAYGRIGTSKLEDYHHAALAAMRHTDECALRAAIAADIRQGMGFIGDVTLGVVQ